eukprot:8317706-Ditylum_brightwellii.AAC.1
MSYNGDIWEIPITLSPQGLGQKNGAAPYIWILVIIQILEVLRKRGLVQIAPSHHMLINELVEISQWEMNLYQGLAKATGGQVSPVNNRKAQLFVNTNRGRNEIKQLPTYVISCSLGVWIAPNGQTKTQLQKLKTITEI